MEGLVLQDGTPLGFFGCHQAPGSSWTQCHVFQSLFHNRNVLDVAMSVSGLNLQTACAWLSQNASFI